MTTVVCDGCETTIEAESLDDVVSHPKTGEAMCDGCADVRCLHCDRHLDVRELSSQNVHERDTDSFVCDTCPRVELPYEFTVTFRREYESRCPPTWMENIYPDVSSNPEAISRQKWRHKVHVTYRMNENKSIEMVGIE